MRNLKRFLAMALTMLMVAGCFSVLSFAFTDDDKIVNYKDEINVLTAMGVIKGQEDGSFNAEGSFTRRQAAIIFARILVGETSAEYENANFKGDKNVTPFTDLDATGDYYGAISIANLQGIVRGNGDNTFNPNGTLMFQEILTMAVRALGYDSETMNNGYPVSYIIKAKELGLLKGIANVPASTAVATRGVVAKVVYNMLFDVKTADNKTLVEVKFPGAFVKNVVLTAVKGYNLTGVDLPTNTTGGGYVALNALNADGSLDTEVTYFFPWAELDTTGDAKEYVGTSYRIITLDNFKTLIAAQMNGRDILTGVKAVNDKGVITLDSKAYLLVKKYSTIYNTGATWTGNNEIIMLNISAGTATIKNLLGIDGAVLVDAQGNILEKGTHQILYYHMPEFATEFETIYGVEITDGVIVPAPMQVVVEDDRVAISVDDETLSHPYFTYTKDDLDQKYNRYVKVIAYDDNNDGLYDRGVWARYNYGRYTTDDKNAYATIGAHTATSANDTVKVAKGNVVLDDASIKLASGDYVTWYYNPVSGLLHIGKEFTAIGGYLRTFDYSKNQFTVLTAEENSSNWFEITAAGKTYTAVDDKLYGAHTAALIVPNGDWTILEDLIGQYITFIYDEVSGKVITIFDNTDNFYMFDSIISYQFDGYANLRVFNFKTLKYEIIKAHTINDYPYYTYQGFGNAGAANEIEGVLEYGDILTVTTDGKGFNNVQTGGLDAFVDAYFYNEGKQLYLEFDGHTWHRKGFPSNQTYAPGSGALPKYYVILNEEVGPYVIDLTKAKVGAYIKHGNGRESANFEILKISDDIWAFTPEMAKKIEIGSWIGGNAASVNNMFAQSGKNGGVYDIVYYDGSLNPVSVSAGATGEFAHIWGYNDNKLKDTNGRRMNGFTSFYGNVDEDYGMVYSYNSKLEAGWYSLIQFNGKIFIGRELDIMNSDLFTVEYVANKQSFVLDPATGIIENKQSIPGDYVIEIRASKGQDTIYGVDGASNSSNGFSVIVKGSGIDAIPDAVTTTIDFAKKAVTDVTYLTPAAQGDISLVNVDILAQKTTTTVKTDAITGEVTTDADVELGEVVGVVYGKLDNGNVDKNTVLGKIIVVAVSDADENGWRTFTFAVTVGNPENLAPITETYYNGLATNGTLGDPVETGFVVSAADKNNIDAILSAPSQTPGTQGGTATRVVVIGQTHKAANIDANGDIEGIATFTYDEAAGTELYFNIAFEADATATTATIATTDMIEIFDEPKPVV